MDSGSRMHMVKGTCLFLPGPHTLRMACVGEKGGGMGGLRPHLRLNQGEQMLSPTTPCCSCKNEYFPLAARMQDLHDPSHLSPRMGV